MILPIFRPIYRDELLYGWIADLAQINFKGDPRGIQRVANILFPYAYEPERRYTSSKEALRMDFIRGIDESLRENSKKGYSFPDTFNLLAYNTVLYTMSVSRTASTQARYLFTALSSVYGDIMDMPALPSSVKEIKVCPVCMAQANYIRTWHHIPGVTACAVHRVRLFNHDDPNTDKSELPEDHPDVIYAKYCKRIYDNPSTVSLETIKKIMRTLWSPDEAAVLNRKSTKFQTIVGMLIRHKIDYEEIAKETNAANPSSRLDGYHVIRENRGITEVSCNRCGHVFTWSVAAIKEGFGCPVCMRSVHPTDFVSSILKCVGDGKYKLDMPFGGMGAVQDVTHISCGRTASVRMISKLWDKQVCRCETINKIEKMQEQVGREFIVLSYIPTDGIATILHKRCGFSRDYNWHSFKGNPVCPYCKTKDLREDKRKRLSSVLGDDYTIQDDPPKMVADNVFTVVHKLCGTLVEGTLTQFQGTAEKGPKRCPICTSYYKDKRFSGLTYEGTLYLEMKEWFKSHTTWISRRHPENHTKRYYESLVILEKAGVIHRLSPGIYSDRTDLSVYDVLTEKYLVDDNGKPCGRFTGKAADYLAGKGDDPDLITLETALLARKSFYHTVVCGRNVYVKGC